MLKRSFEYAKVSIFYLLIKAHGWAEKENVVSVAESWPSAAL